MLLLKIQAFSYGKSGVNLETVERLIYFFNNSIFPVVYEQGSLGASGDLSPLAHFSLPLLGLGEVNYRGSRMSSSDLFKQLKLKPITLKSKEGLALLNGTQFMSAYAVHCVLKARKLNSQADFIAAISLDAFDGKLEPFEAVLHQIRPHKGQIDTAETFRKILDGSQLIKLEKKQVQDPYSFRCIPQVHGASKDTLEFVSATVETEINSVTDNPTIFPEEDKILSGGNFHGQPLALALDFLSISVAELANISERRIYQLISGLRNLPAFLCANPGLNSGLMIPQYTAASIVSQNKQLCHPASVDSIVSSNGQEDHVSMGANAATKCHKVMQNTERVLAIELINASQALHFRRPLKSSKPIEKIIKAFQSIVPFIESDKVMYQEMEAALQFLKSWRP
jgi:histidine ammonia-lyase